MRSLACGWRKASGTRLDSWAVDAFACCGCRTDTSISHSSDWRSLAHRVESKRQRQQSHSDSFCGRSQQYQVSGDMFAIGAKFRTRSTAARADDAGNAGLGWIQSNEKSNPGLQSLQTAVATARTAGQDADEDQLKSRRELLAAARLQLVRARGCEVCIGLQSLQLHALRLAEIIRYSSWPAGDFMPFHVLWGIATKVKHFPTSFE
jgi:hypothetical protein